MPGVMESPEYVQTSLAGAICLGLEPGRFMPHTQCTCLNLLLTYSSACRASCSYCGLAHNRQVDASKTFIRVKWPTYALTEILDRVENKPHAFKRVCVSMITHSHALEDTCAIMAMVREVTGLPVSGLLAPTVMKGKEDLQKIKASGAERVGIAIDAATEDLFIKHRGAGVGGPHRWGQFWGAVQVAVQVFGLYSVGVHLIVGLGETEQEMVKTISHAYQLGALTHLFSFFPEGGSLLENHPQPHLGTYRRIQMARYLINEGIIDEKVIEYSPKGQIVGFGVEIEPYMQKGIAFMTSGCPGEDGQVACNRPFGNERASEPMRNYPFRPATQDIEIISSQIWDGVADHG
ncbi:MAG TPA: radical SAM protein [Syntrophomonadaceae bacterium]|nr:radical SAM protein [Syntrophomonadaceae bacterium]